MRKKAPFENKNAFRPKMDSEKKLRFLKYFLDEEDFRPKHS